jgi:hypothetical protein
MRRAPKNSIASKANAALQLDSRRGRALEQTLLALESLCRLDALFFHGSFTRGTHDSRSDIDGIAVVQSKGSAISVCRRLVGPLAASGELRLWHYTERYPWFGRLLSLQFYREGDVLIEIGVIARGELRSFFVEPTAIILRDWRGAVFRRRSVCRRERRRADAARVNNMEFEVVHLMDKVLASIERGHFWNAFETINLLRRLYVDLWRQENDVGHHLHVGRAERDLETVASRKLLGWLEGTIPELTVNSLAAAALGLVVSIGRLRLVHLVLVRSRLVTARRHRLRQLVATTVSSPARGPKTAPPSGRQPSLGP